MSFLESLGVAAFLISIVFFALFALFVCIRIFSRVVEKIEEMREIARSGNSDGVA